MTVNNEQIIRYLKDGYNLVEITKLMEIENVNKLKDHLKDNFKMTFNELKDSLYVDWLNNYIQNSKSIKDITESMSGHFTNEFKSVGKDAFSNLFKRLFKYRVKEYANNIFFTKEKIEELIITCPTNKEFRDKSDFGNSRMLEIYISYGVQNYTELRIKIMNESIVNFKKPNNVDDNLSFLLGLLIGDGSLDKTRFRFEHKTDNLDYLMLKIDILQSVFPHVPGSENIKKRVINHQSGKIFNTVTYRTSINSNKYADKIRNILYDSNGNKFVHDNLLDYLNAESILLWYLDDGTLPINKKDRYRGNTIELCTDNFTLEDNEKLIKQFKDKWDIQFSLKTIHSHDFGYKNKLGNINYRLDIKKMEEVLKFLKLFVLPYKDIIPKSMLYKSCPQIYWSNSLSENNLCGKSCSIGCPFNINIKRNEVLVNGNKC